MKDKKIMIIGGTGALGKSLIKRYYNNNEIIVFSRDEHKHYNLVKKYPKIKNTNSIKQTRFNEIKSDKKIFFNLK